MQLCKITLLIILSIQVLFVFGQSNASDSLTQSKKYFKLPANSRLNQVSWRDSIYSLPSFEYARITLATGFTPEQQLKMNYNSYFQQMDYISAKGDTLQIKPSKELKLVTIEDHVFLHDYKIGYIEIIQQLPVALGVRNVMRLQYYVYQGRRLYGGNDERGTPSIYDRFYQKGVDYYFIDKDNKPYKASPSSAYKLFEEHKDKVKAYLDEHRINFEDSRHLMMFLTFCNELKQENGK